MSQDTAHTSCFLSLGCLISSHFPPSFGQGIWAMLGGKHRSKAWELTWWCWEMLSSDPSAWEGEITHRDSAESTKEEGTTKPEREEADGKDKRQRRRGKMKGPQTTTTKNDRSGTRCPAFQNLKFCRETFVSPRSLGSCETWLNNEQKQWAQV